MAVTAGEKFLEESRHHRQAGGVARQPAEPAEPTQPAQPAPAAAAPAAAAPAEAAVELPQPRRSGGAGLWRMLQERRSIRAYTRSPLSLEELGQLLWAQNGRLGVPGPKDRRTAPSAGARYAIETYAVVNNVAGVAPGLYCYDTRGHCLVPRRLGDLAQAVAAAAFDQGMAAQAALVLAWVAVADRTCARYGQRGYRYLFLDTGHVGQNLHLAVAAMGLGCCMVGSFYDDEMNAFIGVDGTREVVLYMATVGRPAAGV